MRGALWSIVTVISLSVGVPDRALARQAAGSATPTNAASQPATDLEKRVDQIDRRAARIVDLTADFEQVKHSAVLAEPLVSKGEVRAKGGVTLWSTREPDETRTRIDPELIRIYYVKSRAIEEYPIEHGLGSLAASPLPRLDTLRSLFTIAEDSGPVLTPLEVVPHSLTLLLTPIGGDVKKFIATVRVLLDADRGLVLAFELKDPDGEVTLIRFSKIRANTGLLDADVDLKPAADTRISRPFDAAPKR